MVEETEATVRVAVAVWPDDNVTLTLGPEKPEELLRDIDGPFGKTGAVEKLSFTFPAKVFRLVRVIVEELEEPKGTVRVGLAVMVKSGTSTFRDRRVVLVAVPLLANTVTV